MNEPAGSADGRDSASSAFGPAPASAGLGPDAENQRLVMLELAARIAAVRAEAITPAVERSLELAEMHLFLALTYLGHTNELFPGQRSGAPR